MWHREASLSPPVSLLATEGDSPYVPDLSTLVKKGGDQAAIALGYGHAAPRWFIPVSLLVVSYSPLFRHYSPFWQEPLR